MNRNDNNYQIELYRSWSPMKRLEAAALLYQFAKEIIRNREKQRHPTFSPKALEVQVRTFFR